MLGKTLILTTFIKLYQSIKNNFWHAGKNTQNKEQKIHKYHTKV